MIYQHIRVPAQGRKISVNADLSLDVPDQPIVPYIEGDGTGIDITPVMLSGGCSGGEGIWRAQADPLDGDVRRREGHSGPWAGCVAS